ncbi:MAG: RIP metalloprotease RseP [Bacteroidales bacterium]|nr:RIP metalloprotease RseP [Bacteroidales bacterium]
MIILFKALQVILALSLLIFIHELGHFFWARLFGIRVEKFYLFFDIGGVRLASWKWGDTEFGIGWLPLGGYCKIAGMVDESMDLESLKGEPQKWEFRTHPAWQRMLVMAGGILNNLIFAILAFIVIMAIWGSAFIPNDGNRIYVNELAYEMGFRSGDQVIAFDDYHPSDFSRLQADLARRNVHKATVLRGNDTVNIYIDHAMIGEVISVPNMFDLAVPFVIDSVAASGANAASDLRRGDRIIAFEGRRVEFVQDSREVLAELKDRKIEATVVRQADTLAMHVQVDSSGRIGVYMQSPQVSVRDYSLLEAIPAGIKLAGETISGYVSDLKLVGTPSTGAYKSVGSFIAIGQVFPSKWNWYQFLNILALLSVMLGIMNLLPIPGLDGGHILFTLYEMISGRKPSDRFLYIAQLIGMVPLLALMFLAFSNDITRLINP